MQTLYRDDTLHDVAYVRLSDAQAEIESAVAAEREHWMRCAALMLVARSSQITDARLAEQLVNMVDEQRPNS